MVDLLGKAAKPTHVRIAYLFLRYVFFWSRSFNLSKERSDGRTYLHNLSNCLLWTPEKSGGFKGILTYDLCDVSAVLYQLRWFFHYFIENLTVNYTFGDHRLNNSNYVLIYHIFLSLLSVITDLWSFVKNTLSSTKAAYF